LRKFSLKLEPAALDEKGKCANQFATEAPVISNRSNIEDHSSVTNYDKHGN
jgi:hypothetical protein